MSDCDAYDMVGTLPPTLECLKVTIKGKISPEVIKPELDLDDRLWLYHVTVLLMW